MKKININKIIVLIIAFGFISGIVYFTLKNNTDYSYYIKDFLIKSKQNSQQLTFQNTLIIILIYMLSLTLIGLIFIFGILFILSFSIGFTISLFFYYLKTKGLIFYVLFFIETKLINSLLLIYFINKSCVYIVNISKYIINKNEKGILNTLSKHFLRFIIVFTLIIVNSFIIKYLFNNLTLYLISIL